MKTILEARHISKSFNGLNVLEDVTFSLEPGSIMSLFGENGSGKTTLFHIISGYLKADHGEVLYKEKDLNGKKPVEIARLGVGRVWQTPRICRNLPVQDNLLLASAGHPGEQLMNYFIRPKSILKEEKTLKTKSLQIADDIGLFGKLRETAGSLSFGQKKLLSIGMVLMNNAQLLLLDEPFAGVNAKMVDHISEVLVDLKKKGKTILLIEHNRSKAKKISDDVFTLVKGKIVQEKAKIL